MDWEGSKLLDAHTEDEDGGGTHQVVPVVNVIWLESPMQDKLALYCTGVLLFIEMSMIVYEQMSVLGGSESWLNENLRNIFKNKLKTCDKGSCCKKNNNPPWKLYKLYSGPKEKNQ